MVPFCADGGRGVDVALEPVVVQPLLGTTRIEGRQRVVAITEVDGAVDADGGRRLRCGGAQLNTILRVTLPLQGHVRIDGAEIPLSGRGGPRHVDADVDRAIRRDGRRARDHAEALPDVHVGGRRRSGSEERAEQRAPSGVPHVVLEHRPGRLGELARRGPARAKHECARQEQERHCAMHEPERVHRSSPCASFSLEPRPLRLVRDGPRYDAEGSCSRAASSPALSRP